MLVTTLVPASTTAPETPTSESGPVAAIDIVDTDAIAHYLALRRPQAGGDRVDCMRTERPAGRTPPKGDQEYPRFEAWARRLVAVPTRRSSAGEKARKKRSRKPS